MTSLNKTISTVNAAIRELDAEYTTKIRKIREFLKAYKERAETKIDFLQEVITKEREKNKELQAQVKELQKRLGMSADIKMNTNSEATYILTRN